MLSPSSAHDDDDEDGCRREVPPMDHAHRLAPPDSIASISACDHASRWKRSGSSERSKYMPSLGSTGPSALPALPPMRPPTAGRWMALRGPCCCAFLRYEAKDEGSSWVGEAGCGWGVWSISDGDISSGVRRPREGAAYWLAWCAFPESGSWAGARASWRHSCWRAGGQTGAGSRGEEERREGGGARPGAMADDR